MICRFSLILFASLTYGNAVAQQEVVFPSLISADPGARSISIPFVYSTKPSGLQTSGLEISVFFDSSWLAPSGIEDLYEESLQKEPAFLLQVADDGQNEDGDLNTDSKLTISYKKDNGTWPSVNNSPEGLKIFDLVFRALETSFKGQSKVNIALKNHEIGLVEAYANGALAQSQLTICFDCFSLDIDGDGRLDPLTDGILFFRYLLPVTGILLTQDLSIMNGSRSKPPEISSYLDIHSARLDIDGDGDLNPLTDGVLVLRYLSDLRGDELIQSAVGENATRTSAEEIEAYLAERVGTGIANRPPVFVSLPKAVEVDENQVVVITVSAEDPDGDSIVFELAGDDAENFVITSNGELSFVEPPNFEEKDYYTLDVAATDSIYRISSPLEVSILDVEETPRINNLPFSKNVPENQKSVLTIAASDPNGDTLLFSLSGSDASMLEVTPLGVLTFREAPDFETKRRFNLTVEVSDGANEAIQSLKINIDDVNEPPADISLSSSNVTENIAGAKIGDVTVVDPEGDSSTLSLGGQDSEIFEFNGSELKLLKNMK